ncbi:calcium-binding protein [Falsiroseomonas stagni]|uniref:Hemolysin-type calcium-binding repeat-containing protein n=1 Tax=Falsiroseomonas stagni DSM 19981 TaxID=1123062 RepID=A0A1I3XSZ2_9PROT|nr:hypothetical protein [Falsiroseomonas stagni]SFK22419.1 hypothetical protein SAMN02745775_101606 [Falsiroseomonas stagni DSM 19981]
MMTMTTTATPFTTTSTSIGAGTRPAFLSARLVCSRAQHDPVAKAHQAWQPKFSADNVGVFDVTRGLNDGPIRLASPDEPIPPGMKFFFEVQLRHEGEFRGDFQRILEVGDNFVNPSKANAIAFGQFFAGSEVAFEIFVGGQSYQIFGANTLIQGETATRRIQVTDANIVQLYKSDVLIGQREVPDIRVIPRDSVFIGRDSSGEFTPLRGEFLSIRSDIDGNQVEDALPLPPPNLPRPIFVEPRDHEPNPVPGGVDTLAGGAGNDLLDGGAGADLLTGGGMNDVFRFARGQAQGDVVADFIGNGSATGDRLEFRGYGSAAQGASFAQIDALTWRVTSADGLTAEDITFANAAILHGSDWSFL